MFGRWLSVKEITFFYYLFLEMTPKRRSSVIENQFHGIRNCAWVIGYITHIKWLIARVSVEKKQKRWLDPLNLKFVSFDLESGLVRRSRLKMPKGLFSKNDPTAPPAAVGDFNLNRLEDLSEIVTNFANTTTSTTEDSTVAIYSFLF